MACPLKAQAASVTDVNLVEEKRIEVSDTTVVDPQVVGYVTKI